MADDKKKEKWHCPHCWSTKDKPVDCVRCTREMCEGCISFHRIGKVCGLCHDQLTRKDDDEDD